MVLKAFIDESADERREKFFTMAGYVATDEAWAAFSKDWKAHLNEHGLTRFKLSEMPKSEPEHIASFYRIIENHDIPLSFDCVLDIGMWRMVVGEVEWPEEAATLKKLVDNPYFLVSKKLMHALFTQAQNIGFKEPIDIVFDEQTHAEDILLDAWDAFKGTLHPDTQKLVGTKPSFEDDVKFIPLQAADLIAGYVRQSAINGIEPPNCDIFPWKCNSESKLKRFSIRFNEDLLRRELEWICSRENMTQVLEAVRVKQASSA